MDPTRPDFAATLATLHARHPGTVEPEIPDDDMGPTPDAFAARLGQMWREAIPSRFLHAKLADIAAEQLPPAKLAVLAAWAANPQGRNVMLWGGVGVGKTHAAVAACRGLHFEGSREVLFKPVVELLDELRVQGELSGCTLAEARDVDIVLLDDVGGERPTDWTAERLYLLANRRWLEQRPVVATTNLPLTYKVVPEGYSGPVLEDVVGSRTFSRLVGNGAVVLRMGGPDRRR